MKRIKRFAAVLLASLMLLLMTVPAVNAAYGDPPDGLRWDDYMARWDPVYDSKLWGYQIVLYKDSSMLSQYDIGTPYMDFKDTFLNCGPGEYYFMVCAVYENGSTTIGSVSVYSPTKVYNGELEHKHTLKYRSASDPTCTDDGSIGFFVCTGCGEYFYDEYASQVIYDHSSVIRPKLGHDWNDWFVRKEPTVNSEGIMERVCKRDPSHYEQKPIAKLPQKPPEPRPETVPPTTKAVNKQVTAKATEATTVKPSTVAPTTVPSTQPAGTTLSATAPSTGGIDNGGKSIGSVLSNPIFIIVAIVLGFLIFIATPAAIVLFIVLMKKRRK